MLGGVYRPVKRYFPLTMRRRGVPSLIPRGQSRLDPGRRAAFDVEEGEVIDTRGRLGSFIAATGDPTRRQAQLAAVDYAQRMRVLGLGAEDALTIVSAALGIRS